MLSKRDHLQSKINGLKLRIQQTSETLDHLQAAQDALIKLRQEWRSEVNNIVDEFIEENGEA